MTTPASISPPKPAASLKGPGAHRNSCRRTLPILTPLSTAGFPSNNASGNTCLSTTAICIKQSTPCSSNNRHLSGKDYSDPEVGSPEGPHRVLLLLQILARGLALAA